MNITPHNKEQIISDNGKPIWESIVTPVDNFTITEWPGKVEDTSIICDIAVHDLQTPLHSFVDALIPYSQPIPENLNYFEVFELDKDETKESVNNSALDYADSLDKGIAVASGLFSGIIDVLFVGEFSLERAKQFGEKDVENLVVKTAKKFGYKGNDIAGAIEHLEKKFPFASDSKTNDFGGARQHHLWDFSHHFSLFGLLCSVLMQFTGKVMGTDGKGRLVIRDVSDNCLIGKNIPEQIFLGTVHWFFHMVSDMAGSSGCIGRGTGIPGPIISMIKTISAIPFFRNIRIDNIELYAWINRLFGGGYFKKRDENGNLIDSIPFDLRTEIGILHEGSKQLVPILVNEAIVRSFYFIRRTYKEIVDKGIHSLSELGKIDPQKILPFNTPAIKRMCTISSGVFCAIDMIDAFIRAIIDKKPSTFFLRLNYIGIARFMIAIGVEVSSYL